MLPDKTNVVAYISLVADQSGGDDACQSGNASYQTPPPPLEAHYLDTWSQE